jgi:hypothetical protein
VYTLNPASKRVKVRNQGMEEREDQKMTDFLKDLFWYVRATGRDTQEYEETMARLVTQFEAFREYCDTSFPHTKEESVSNSETPLSDVPQSLNLSLH